MTMKFNLIQKTDLAHTGYLVASTALSDCSIAAVLLSHAQPRYRLMVQTIEADTTGVAQEHTVYHDLSFIGPDDFKYSLSPLALIAWDGKPCVLIDKNTAYWFDGSAPTPKKLRFSAQMNI